MYAMRQFAVDNSAPCSKVTSADVLEMLDTIEAGSVGQAGGTQAAGKGPGWDPLTRIPVFRDGKPSGFVDRPGSEAARAAMFQTGLPSDAGLQLCPVNALHRESWIAGHFVGIGVENGIVHFSGEADSMHGVLALRRIAATSSGTRAIVDDLRVRCE